MSDSVVRGGCVKIEKNLGKIKKRKKYKLNRRFYRLVIILLVLCVFFSGIGITTLLTKSSVAKVSNNILVSTATPGVTRVADDSTMNSYKNALINEENGSRYAGRVWTDKSVFAYGDTSNVDGITWKNNILSFGNEENPNEWQVETSDDFLHVFSALSTSQQIIWRQHAPLDIVLVLDLSGSMADSVSGNQSRIEAAAQAVNTLLENISDMTDARVGLQVYSSYGSGYAGFQTVLPLDTYQKDGSNNYLNVTKSGGWWFSDPTYSVNVRARSRSDNKIYNEKISSTGGTATQMGIYQGAKLLAEADNTKEVGTDGTTSYRTPVMILITDGVPTYVASNDWWNPSITADSQQYGSGSDNDAGLNFVTMLTASYMKKVVNKHYFGNEDGMNGQAMKFFTISIDAAEEDKDIMGTTFNPKTMWGSGSNMANTLLNYWNQYQANNGEVNVDVCTDQTNSRCRKATTYSVKHPTGDIELDVDDIKYNDAFYDVASTDLNTIFDDIMESLAGEVFDPVSGSNSSGAIDSVTFAEPIGLYMEVKDKAIAVNNPVGNSENVNGGKGVYDMALLLYNEMHGLVKTAVYDASFIKKKGKDFKNGWYDKDGEYLVNQDGDWSRGDIYYLDRDTAVEYVPTIPEDTGDIEDLNYIRYVLYRFAEPYEQRNAVRSNPNYGGSKLTYKLSDIRVWVEESGNYVSSEGMTIPGSEYDSMLYVNIPSVALPVQVAKITLDSDGEILTYDSNVDNSKQSLPLRMFYSVGVRDDVLTEDGLDVDITKISQEYINENKSNNGNLRFLSNYWSDSTYDAYGNAKKYPRGDAALSFSPSDNNRYYLFQDNLTLYKNAYYVNSSGEISPIHDLDNYKTKPLGKIYPGTSESNHLPNSVKSTIESDIQSGQLAKDSVVILDGDVVTRTSEYDANSTYYIVDTYYVPTDNGAGKKVSIVIGRLGKDLSQGSVSASKSTDTYLCWKDESGISTEIYDFDEYPSTSTLGEKWVLSTKKGALRVGNLSENIRAKASNKSGTATNYYLPTIKLQDDNSIVVNNYLGNDGKLEVSDTLLMITKELEGIIETNEDDEFNFEVNIEGKEGIYQGIVLRKHESDYGIHWDYIIESVDVVVDTNGYLLKPDGSQVTTEYNGETVYVKAASSYTYDTTFAISATEDEKDESQRFYVMVDYYRDNEGKHKVNTAEQQLDVWETALGTSHNGNENTLGDLYQTQSSYKTKTIKFGYSDKTKEELEESSSFPNDWSDEDKKLPANTAMITLAPDEGILINGIASGSDYTVTEVIKQSQTKAGVNFKQVIQEMNSSTKTYNYESENSSNEPGNGNGFKKEETEEIKKYTVFGDTGSNVEEIHYTNYDKLKHLTISKGLQPEDGTVVTNYDKNIEFDFNISFENLDGSPLEATIKYTIYNDDDTVATKEQSLVLKGEAGEQFSFKLKANQYISFDDLPLETGYKYELVEKPHDGFESQDATINGTVGANSDGVMPQTVRNIKLVPKVAVSLIGTKTLIGDNLKNEEFEFLITPSTDNPKSDPISDERTVFNKSDGQIPFIDEEYTDVGVYHYHIKEVKGSEKDILYDTKEYDVKVTITEDETEKLWQEVEIKSNGTDVENITFMNIRVQEHIAVSGNKELVGKSLENEEFEFLITPNPENPTGDILAHETNVRNDADGKIELLNGTYTNLGTYRYHVKEVIPSNPGSIIYDTKEYDIKVMIELDKNNQVTSRTELLSDGQEVDSIVFRNIYVNEKIKVEGTKYLTGGTLVDDEFSFTIVPNSSNPKEDPIKETTVKNKKDGTITFIDNSYTKVGTYLYHIYENDPSRSDVIYDKTAYDVSVEIKIVDGSITSEITITSGGTLVPRIEFTNYMIAEQVTLTGVKYLAGKALENQAFHFLITPNEDNPEGDIISGPTTVSNDAEGKISFLNGKYKAAGVYQYEIREVIPSELQNIKYDQTIYNVTITVTFVDGHTQNRIDIQVDGKTKGSISFNNAYQETSVKLEGTKTLVGDKLKDQEFSFVITPDATNPKGDIISGPTTVKNDAEGKISFLNGQYHKVGTYQYRIEESLTQKINNVEYDKSTYMVTVLVTEQVDGSLTNSVIITKDNTDVSKIHFTNYYIDLPITITGRKHLEGKDIEDQEFSFMITPDTTNPKGDALTEETIVKNDADGKIIFIDGKYTEIGIYKYKIREMIPEDIQNIKYDTNEYNVTVTISTADNKVEKKIEITSNNAETSSIEFTNIFKSMEINLNGKKYLTGDKLKGNDFTFEMIPEEENPAEDPIQDVLIVTNDAEGNIPFLHHVYTQPGTYKYQIREKSDHEVKNMQYDDTTYEVTVIVEKDDFGLLTHRITITSDDNPVTEIIFTNIRNHEVPNTLDNSMKSFIMLIVAMIDLGISLILYKKCIAKKN